MAGACVYKVLKHRGKLNSVCKELAWKEMRRDRRRMAVVVVVVGMLVAAAAGQQVATSCTASVVSTFTPCLNFVTGSTNGGGSPTRQCCKAVAGLVRTGADCACLILTGNVPLSLPFVNRSLALSLPKLCNSQSVPLQCRDTATTIPAPGPVPFSPALPPLPAVDSTETGTSPVVESPTMIQGQRPVVVPSSATRSAGGVLLAPASVVLLVAASILV